MTKEVLKNAVCAAILACSLSSLPAFAGVPTNFAALPQGSWVQGTAGCGCSAVNGNFVRPSDLLTSEQNLEQAILAVGKVLNTGQMQQLQAQVQELNQVLQEKAMTAKEMAAAQAVESAKQQVSMKLKVTENGHTYYANQPGSLCSAMSMAQNLGQGLAVNRKIADGMGSALAAYDQSDDSAMNALSGLANAPQSTLSASSIFPTAAASSVYPTPSEAAQAVAHLTEPVPPVQLNAAQKKTPAGKMWMAQENAIEAKLSMAQNALATIAAWHQPTIDAQYFVQTWQSMQKASGGDSGNDSSNTSLPPGVNAQNKISPDGALNLMIEKRFANPYWYKELAVQDTAGALKDMTEMEAIDLRVHWESLRMAEYLAGLSADQYAHEVVDPTNASLTGLNGNAMAQDNGAFHGK